MARHLASGSCFQHVPFLDRLVDGLLLPCSYKEVGCDTMVAYHAHADHMAICSFKPAADNAVCQQKMPGVFTVDKALLTCTSCKNYLRAPFFSCPTGHGLCQGCGSADGSKICGPCGVVTPFTELRTLPILDGLKLSCNYPGCQMDVPYYALFEHQQQNGH